MEKTKTKRLEDRQWVPIHKEICLAALDDFQDSEDAMNFLRAVFTYAITGELPEDYEFRPSVRPMWRFAKEKLDVSNKKFLNSPGPPTGSRNNPNGRGGKELTEN
ncbi:MAG: hypothetical protein II454_00375 [Bacteroidales bacterium]|nr:hypothetical protein [Bacteroidales bacterium]